MTRKTLPAKRKRLLKMFLLLGILPGMTPLTLGT